MPAENNKFDRKNKDKPQNYVELTEAQKIESELNAIHTKLTEGKLTIENAKAELKKINDWLQKKDIDQWYKEQISNAFDKLSNNLEKNIQKIDQENAQKANIAEIKEIAKLVQQSTNKQLNQLKQSVQRPTPERPKDVQKWIKESSENLIATVHNAKNDTNVVARKIWERMENLMS